jgi:hypothetical protein
LILFICIGFLSACQSAKDAMTLKKKSSSDEFLVEKKNPLVLPPEYGELPLPGNLEIEKTSDETDIRALLNKGKTLDQDNAANTTPTSIEESVLKKIK